jgi:MoaA/NifB/PqqE/SkfB family radical SAM enzyme
MEPSARSLRIFTLLLETRCNSYCVFCGSREVDEALRRSRERLGLSVPEARYGDTRGRYTLETATAAVRAAREQGFLALSLQGGEPTLWPDLVPLVRAAHELSFHAIGLVTNGRRLADPKLADGLVEAGLDGISVSLLGADAATHDALSAAPGSFDALVRGLRAIVEASKRHGRSVFITANLVTTARSVDQLPAQVELLADCGAMAATVHLVRFEGLASDPGVREPLRFDVRRIREPLARARALGAARGVTLHAPDVPLCLHPQLLAEEVRRVVERASIAEHRFEAAAYAYDLDHSEAHVRPDACEGCWFDAVCRRVPGDYLPDDPADALRPLDEAAVRDALVAVVDSAPLDDPRSPGRIEDALLTADRLEAMQGRAGSLQAVTDHARTRLAECMTQAAAARDGHRIVASLCTWLGLFPPRTRVDDDVAAFASVSARRLAAHVGAVAPRAAEGRQRLVFGGTFEVVLDATVTEPGTLDVRALAPVVPPASSPAERLMRAVFLLWICQPLRGATRLRLQDGALQVNRGAGWATAWSIARAGAVTLVDPAPLS